MLFFIFSGFDNGLCDAATFQKGYMRARSQPSNDKLTEMVAEESYVDMFLDEVDGRSG